MRTMVLLALVFGVYAEACAQSTDARIRKYYAYSDKVEKIILQMNEVAVGPTERADLRALAFLLNEYDQAVAACNWDEAISIAYRMQAYMARGAVVADDAARRKEAWARAEAERRHREELAQRERHHRELLAAQARALQAVDPRYLAWYLYGR